MQNNEEKMFNQYPDVVDVKTLALMLGIGFNSAYHLVSENKIPSVKIGRVHRIPKAAIISFVKGESNHGN